MIGRTNTGGGGGGGGMNFRILDGTSAPNSPKANDIWLNTNTKIPGWYFTPTEPNVETLTRRGSDWDWKIQRTLKDGDILNFTIPTTVATSYGSLEVTDGTGKMFFIRDYSGGILSSWQGGYKVGLIISGNQARLYTQGGYYHKEGLAWITVGTTSPVAFNALKKNGITVFPISAKQWVNGAWVDVKAKSYQNGEWVEWFPEGAIYCNGAFAVPVSAVDGGGATRGSVTLHDGYFLLAMGTAGYAAQAITESPINVTGYKTMTVDFNSLSPLNNNAEIKIFANTSRADATSLPASIKLTGQASGTLTLDISGLGTGEYYLAISLWNSNVQSAKITDWRLNK